MTHAFARLPHALPANLQTHGDCKDRPKPTLFNVLEASATGFCVDLYLCFWSYLKWSVWWKAAGSVQVFPDY